MPMYTGGYIVLGTQNSQGKGGKGEGGGRSIGSVRVRFSKCCCIVPSGASSKKNPNIGQWKVEHQDMRRVAHERDISDSMGEL